MAIKCRIWWDEQAQAYVVSSSYSVGLVDGLKHLIPAGERDFDPTTKFWYIKEKYGDFARKVAEQAFGPGSVSFTSKTVAQQAHQQQRQQSAGAQRTNGQSTLEDAVVAFAQLVGLDAMKQAFRRAAQDMHPDKPGGSAQKMAELNDLWSRVEKEFYKK